MTTLSGTPRGQVLQPMIGESAPTFNLNDLKGKSFSLADQRVNSVVIHFGTSWWPFCNAEAPHLETLHQKYKDQGVQVFVINVKESKTKASRWAKALGFTCPVLLDIDGEVATRYAPPGVLPDLPRNQIPIASNLIIGRDGKIRFFSLLDSVNFDARLLALTARLDQILGGKPSWYPTR